jgi:hypothetical protein
MLHTHVARALCAAPSVALAASLFVTTLGAPAPTAVAAAPAEPAARLQVVVKQIEILDDREGWLSGKGDMYLRIMIRRCKDGAPPCEPSVRVSFFDKHFAASTGDVVALDLVVPGEGSETILPDGEGVTSELGFPVLAGEQYAVYIMMLESDRGVIDGDDVMGQVVHVLGTGDQGLGIGTHVGRATGADSNHIGDFIVTYEIRRVPLPDLRPVRIQVHDLPGSDRKRACMPVQNVGLGEAGPHEVALRVDGVVPPGGRAIATGPGPGTAHEVCVEAVLPTSGQHTLAAVVDEPRALVEYDETNNVHEQRYQTTGPTPAPPTPKPSTAQPDLTVDAITVNGRVSDGKDDCKDGKNTVTVVVKNGGKADAGEHGLVLAVDGSNVAKETVSDLKAGQEQDVRIDGVRLKKGQHTLTATVDSEKAVAESDEGNNALKVTASCKDDD